MTSPTVNSANKSSADGSSGSLSFSHTISGNSNRILIIAASAWWDEGYPSVNAASYNGVAATSIIAQQYGLDGHMRLLYLPEASLPGAGTYTVSLSVSNGSRIYGGALELYGVDPTTPLGTPAQANAFSGSPSLNISAAIGDIVYSFAAVAWSLSLGANSPQTEHFNFSLGGNHVSCASWETAAANPENSSYWVDNSTHPYGIQGVAIKGVAAAASPSGNFFLFM